MSDCRHNVPPHRLADAIATLATRANQIHATLDSNGNWSIVAHGDNPGSTVNGYRPEPRTPPTAA